MASKTSKASKDNVGSPSPEAASIEDPKDISASEEQLLQHNTEGRYTNAGGGGTGSGVGSNDAHISRLSTNLVAVSSISNASNTSLTSSATNSSRGDISQTGNQSSLGGASSQRSIIGHQQSSSTSSQQQNPNFDSNVISERVKNLATQIYQELKRIISRCNYDEDILSGLMPLIVRVLESLDLALIENQQLQVELELCKDDNEQLVIMFEKEKAAKRAIDKKLIESEYAYEEERQQYQQKIESLDSVVKMYELKTKNASDQAARFEEKEAERKREYQKLHDRYTELLKSHCDVVERFRHLAGNSEVANLGSINVPQQLIASGSDMTVGDLQPHPLNKLKLTKDDDFTDRTGTLKASSTLRSWNPDAELTLEDASLIVIDDMVGDSHNKSGGDVSSHNESDRATTSEPEGEHEKESENDSIAYTSMEKEFRKLIQENKDLLNTKNALNVVKDDLIAEVDRLTNEVSMYEQAVEQLNSTKDQMKQKLSALDAELRKTKEELEKAKQKIRENNEEGVPYSQRKRFGRAEMAKVLMERNNYKERFMELQDAVKYTEFVRANRMETEKRSGLWKFFSNLFGAPPPMVPPTKAILGPARNSSPVVQYAGSGGSAGAGSMAIADAAAAADALQVVGAGPGGAGAGSIRSTNQRLSSNADMIVLMDSDLHVDRGRALGTGTARARSCGADSSGYIQAYGWSLRASSLKGLSSGGGVGASGFGGMLDQGSGISPILGGTSSTFMAGGGGGGLGESASQVGALETSLSFSSGKLAGLQVPIPQYCRPLAGDSLGMKIWCATAIDLSGGDLNKMSAFERQVANTALSTPERQETQRAGIDSSGSVVNISTSTPVKSPAQQQALRQLEQEVSQALASTPEGARLASNIDASSSSAGAEGAQGRLGSALRVGNGDVVFSALPHVDGPEDLSTCIWICSTQHSRSKINIVDIKTKPNELLDTFYVPTFLYCIKSIPGCKPSDLPGLASAARKSNAEAADGEQSSSAAAAATAATLQRGTTCGQLIDELISNQRDDFYKMVKVNQNTQQQLRRARLSEAATVSANQSVASDAAKLEESKSSEFKHSSQITEDDAEISRILDNNVSESIAKLQKLNDFVAHIQPQESERSLANETSASDRNESTTTVEGSEVAVGETSDCNQRSSQVGDGPAYYQPISTHLSTVWMGGKDSVLYVHSAIGQWKDCVACVELHDSILQICHFRGRAFVSLADGSLCVFFRHSQTKEWDFSQYLLVNVGLLAEATSDNLGSDLQSSNSTQDSDGLSGASMVGADVHTRLVQRAIPDAPQPDGSASSWPKQQLPIGAGQQPKRTKVAGVHCLEISNKNLWLGHRNRVLILDPITLRLKHTFNVVPQVDNQIRQLVSMKDGVFICLRSDLTLRLYSSLRPYQHIQNIDIEPIVTRLISPKTFVISHITAMRVVDNTLWIGIAHGIILTIPCKLVPQISEAPIGNSQTGELEQSPSHLSIARFVPKCDLNNAQISFHGHRDAVKFFVHAHQLMLSGGQGYLDFRLDMDDQPKAISDKSHLILWQLPG